MFHCDYCRLDISQLVRIKCAECTDFDLCLECFQRGEHVAPHRPDHAYRVVNNVKTPLWAEDWGADEELLLLEALEMFGMGNWSDVADHVGSKNKTQCEDHYDAVYCSNDELLPVRICTRTHRTRAQAHARTRECRLRELFPIALVCIVDLCLFLRIPPKRSLAARKPQRRRTVATRQ